MTGSIASYYSATATLEPNKQAEVLARVGGIVEELHAEEGDHVASGDMLLRIEEDEYRYRLRQAEAEEVKQRSRYQRLEAMVAQELVSAEEFDTARSDLQAATAARELAALELSRTQVTAPFTGKIVARAIDAGQMVTAGTALFSIVDMDPLLARVHVPAKELRSIKTDQAVELVLDSTGEVLQGRISLISPVIDPNSGTIKITVEILTYPDTTRPGDFAEVRIVTERHEDAILVPKAAVFTDKGEQIVYVAADSVALRRVVEAGFRNERFVEILRGLAVDEQVIIQGQRSLEDGQPLRILAPLEVDSTSAEAHRP